MLNRKQPPPIAETAEIILALDRRGQPLPLREQPAYAAKMAEIARAAGVRDRARQRDERARARSLNPPASRGAVERMKDLAAGAVIPGTDPAHEQQAAREEVAIARAAEAVLHGELAEITSELSYAFVTQPYLRPRHVLACRFTTFLACGSVDNRDRPDGSITAGSRNSAAGWGFDRYRPKPRFQTAR